MELQKLNELIDGLDENNRDEQIIKGILLGLRGAMLTNRHFQLFEHMVPWIRQDRDRNVAEVARIRANRN